MNKLLIGIELGHNVNNSKILAAGGVLWRLNGSRELEIAVIHRPRYNDWTLPKGKLDPGETLITTAYREILEETGIKTKFGSYLDHVTYEVPTGLKEVHYWSARAISPLTDFEPNEEVDEIKWLDWKSASALLTRKSDLAILNTFLLKEVDTTSLVLLRHAKAIARSEWRGEDEDRPLADLGRRQSIALVKQLAPYDLKSIYSSDAVRCLDTVTPLSDFLAKKVKVNSNLSEYRYAKNSEKVIEEFKDLRKEAVVLGENTLICSHNPILPSALKKLLKKSDIAMPTESLEPGDAWILHMRKREIVQVDYLPVPKLTAY
jgi:8-oxo-(d)GTP phosphatase